MAEQYISIISQRIVSYFVWTATALGTVALRYKEMEHALVNLSLAIVTFRLVVATIGSFLWIESFGSFSE